MTDDQRKALNTTGVTVVPLTEDEYWQTTQAMIDFGGSFIKKLAEMLRNADSNNRTRLLHAFPEYIQQYRDMAHTLNAEGYF